MRILHLSDPHVPAAALRERPLRDFGRCGRSHGRGCGKGAGRLRRRLERLRQIVRDADALRADPVVCTGDLTQLAMEEEFALGRTRSRRSATG